MFLDFRDLRGYLPAQEQRMSDALSGLIPLSRQEEEIDEHSGSS